MAHSFRLAGTLGRRCYSPLSGASGAQEGGFLAFFRDMFPPGQISIAMFVWRFFTYYVHLITGAVLLLVQMVWRFVSKPAHSFGDDCLESYTEHETKLQQDHFLNRRNSGE